MAHEIGHEYFWNDYWAASSTGDARRLRELELRSDAIAVFTLLDLSLEPASLTSAAARLASVNRRLRAVANAHSYPSDEERRRFVRGLTRSSTRASR